MSGSSTRDWLLDKLLKLRQAMSEQKAAYARDTAILEDSRRSQLREADLRVERVENEREIALRAYKAEQEENEGLRERIVQMAPGRQFRFYYRCADSSSIELHATSISHTNGVTTVNVERTL